MKQSYCNILRNAETQVVKFPFFNSDTILKNETPANIRTRNPFQVDFQGDLHFLHVGGFVENEDLGHVF